MTWEPSRSGPSERDTDGVVTRPEIELVVPAEGASVPLLRTAAAALAARLDFTLDDVEDLRMAIDEAASLLIQQAGQDATLRFAFEIDGPSIVVRGEVPTPDPRPPRPEGFAWLVLTALARSVEVALVTADGSPGLGLRLVHPRGGGEPA